MRNRIYVWVGVFVFVILLSGSVQALVLNYRQPSQIWRKYELFSVMKGSMRNIDTILEIWKGFSDMFWNMYTVYFLTIYITQIMEVIVIG